MGEIWGFKSSQLTGGLQASFFFFWFGDGDVLSPGDDLKKTKYSYIDVSEMRFVNHRFDIFNNLWSLFLHIFRI